MPKRRSLNEAFGAGDKEAKKTRSQEEEKVENQERQSRQYGRRAASGYTQINANVSRGLKSEVRKKLIDEERTMQELLETLLEQYLDGRAG